MYDIKLKVLSPIHIGTDDNQTLNSILDYYIENNKLYLIDHKKLEKFFAENPKIMDDYIKEVRNTSHRKINLEIFLS